MDAPKKIMIADDDPGILDAVEMMLKFEGYNVLATEIGSNVLKLEKEIPDLLLLDIWMAGEDGRDICREFKKRINTKNIPVIMISASTELERSAKEAGADDFLEKPFNMNELLHKIASQLNRNKLN